MSVDPDEEQTKVSPDGAPACGAAAPRWGRFTAPPCWLAPPVRRSGRICRGVAPSMVWPGRVAGHVRWVR